MAGVGLHRRYVATAIIMGVGAVAPRHRCDITAALGVDLSAGFVRGFAGAQDFLHRFHIAAGFVVDMGAICPGHGLGVVALCRMLGVVRAQAGVLRRKCRRGQHGKHHRQTGNNAQNTLLHIGFLLGVFTWKGSSWDVPSHDRGARPSVDLFCCRLSIGRSLPRFGHRPERDLDFRQLGGIGGLVHQPDAEHKHHLLLLCFEPSPQCAFNYIFYHDKSPL